MCPIPLSPQRGRGPAPANDNLYDDASTVCSGNDIESTWSDDDYHSVERFPQYCRQDRAPRFRVKKDEASRQVYEAWNIFFFPERRELVRGTKVLGVKVENYDTLEPRVSRHIQPSEQSDLADVHLGAVRDFEEKHRRGWAGRIFRGKPKTYEQHLDERCGKLPLQVQHSINELLLDRGRASSTMYRTRTWSVASMKEQHAFRFAGTNYAEIKPQKKRFWNRKKTGPNGPLLYSVLIQGKETQACSSPDGIMTTSIWDNPWTNIDNTEARERSRERQRQRDLRRSKRFMSPPSYRSGRERSASPPSYRSSSYRSPRNRYDSPSSYRVRLDRLPIRNRSLSPVPLRNRNRSFSPVTLRTRNRSISPVPVRVRVQRRDRSPDSTTDTFPSPFNRDPFSVPTPPESYAPPPAVSAYSRPFFPPPPPPPAMNPAAPPAWGHFSGLPPPPSGPKFSIPPPFPRPACRACQTVPSCAHWAPTLPCPRPLQATNNGIPTHAPCIQCFPPRPAHQGSAYPSNVFANHYNNVPLVSFPPRPPPPPPGMMPISMPPPRPPFAPFTRPLWSHPQVTVSSPARYAHSLTSSDSESESESDTFFSRSSSPSSSSSKGTGWRKPKVEDHDDDLSDTATEIVDDGDAGPTEINAPATAGSGEGTAAEAEGDKAPDVVVPASEKK